MREILFRGKRLDNGEWVEGNLVRAVDNFDETEHFFITVAGADKLPKNEFVWFHEVDPETVGQYTGLIDKDGKRIFEGDLCDMSILGKDHTLQKIVIRYGAFGFEPVHPNKVHPEDRGWQSFWRNEHQDMWFPDFFTVIGNIHDNPELLGGDNA